MSIEPVVEITPLTTAAVNCPRCTGTIAHANQNGVTTTIPGTFLYTDGDAIPGTMRELDSFASLCMASFGSCPHCKSHYWALDVYLHTGPADAIYELLAEDLDKPDLFLVNKHPGAMWLIEGFTTEHGRAFHHQIGPLVSLIEMNSFWRHAADYVRNITPAIIAAQTEVTRQTFAQGISSLTYQVKSEGLALGKRDDNEPPAYG